MAYDPAKANQMNELAQQNPDADLNTLAFLADVPASDVDNYTIDRNATPIINSNFGRVSSVQATEPKYDWSDVTSDDTNLDAYGDTYQAAEPLPPAYQRPPVPEPRVEPANPGPTATDLSREYTTENATDINNAATETTVYAEDYTVVEPNPIGYERPGLQDDGTIVLDDGDDANFTDNARDSGSSFDEENNIDFSANRVENTTPATVEGTAASEDIITQPGVTEAEQNAIQAQALRQQAQQQQTVNAMRQASGVKNADGDWRVKLRLAPQATYLYKAANPGILAPLTATDGIIFPYTPQIDVQYRAEYNNYQPTHSNYMNYFYKGSSVQTVQIQADFTAQDTIEAEYLLAVIHFLRSASKMFYGQDAERGSPPPLLYLTGLGEYQFNESPCVISEFNYNLPSDVNYIRARGRQITSADNLQFQKPLATSATNGNFASLSRLGTAITNAFNGGPQPLQAGAKPYSAAPGNLGSKGATYVPTKMSMTINLLPIATRQQQSQQFSLREYANGNLIKKGMW